MQRPWGGTVQLSFKEQQADPRAMPHPAQSPPECGRKLVLMGAAAHPPLLPQQLEAKLHSLSDTHREATSENLQLREARRDLAGQLEEMQGQLQVTREHLKAARGRVSWQVEEEARQVLPPLDYTHSSLPNHHTLPTSQRGRLRHRGGQGLCPRG